MVDVELTEARQSAEITLDDELVVTLKQPASSGLVWDVDMTEPIVCTGRDVTASTEAFGAPAVVTYHFSSDAPIHGRITFVLKAPWRDEAVSTQELLVDFTSPTEEANDDPS